MNEGWTLPSSVDTELWMLKSIIYYVKNLVKQLRKCSRENFHVWNFGICLDFKLRVGLLSRDLSRYVHVRSRVMCARKVSRDVYT